MLILQIKTFSKAKACVVVCLSLKIFVSQLPKKTKNKFNKDQLSVFSKKGKIDDGKT